MKKVFIPLLLLCGLFLATAYSSSGQGRGNGNGNGNGKAKGHYKNEGPAKSKGYKQDYGHPGGGPPPWAPAHGYRAKNHVYFPDYYTFYDPRRNGYVYWNNNNWIFSPSVPSFMANIDLGRARIQVLGDIPLTTLPEPNFSKYFRLYPPRTTVNINIPHPPLPGR